MSDYKDLNLNREKIEEHIQTFLSTQGLTADGGLQQQAKGKRITFGRQGADFATVDLFFNQNGTTTIHWKLGKNQAMGEKLAQHLKLTIDPAEFETVNYSLKGVVYDDFDGILSILQEEKEYFSLNIKKDDASSKQVELTSLLHSDHLVVTHHKNTRTLQIQGKPLSCYRKFIFLLTDTLDLKGLEQVLCRKDDGVAEVVRQEMAQDYLRDKLKSGFDLLPDAVRKLLVSGCCIKLASPKLPDYSVLLYPDLRALEGVLKDVLRHHDVMVGELEHGFGDIFSKNTDKNYVVHNEQAQHLPKELLSPLGKAYTFYNKHRHTLFHMEDYADTSRLIDTLDKAIGLSKDVYEHIDELYQRRGVAS